MKAIVKIIIILTFSISYGQYNYEIHSTDIKDIINQSIVLDGEDATIVVRENALISPISYILKKNSNIKILKDSEIFEQLILEYIDFNLIQIESNVALIRYINRHKAKVVSLVFNKKIGEGWVLVDKTEWNEIKFKFNDFLYDSIRREKNKKE